VRQEAQEPDVPASVATTDTVIDPPTVSEVQAWQLPPQVDLRAIAVAMTWTPGMSITELGTTMEQYYSHRDQTE